MTLEDLLPRLEAVRARGTGRWSARCPAHADRSPSLSISEGARVILLKCLAGCSLDEICTALGLTIADLYYDRRPDPAALAEARRQREAREQTVRIDGRCADAVREARALIQSARGINIDHWTPEQLDRALNDIASAHDILRAAGELWYGDYGV